MLLNLAITNLCPLQQELFSPKQTTDLPGLTFWKTTLSLQAWMQGVEIETFWLFSYSASMKFNTDSPTPLLCLCHPALPAGVWWAPVTCWLCSWPGCAELIRHMSVTEKWMWKKEQNWEISFLVKEGLSFTAFFLTANILVLPAWLALNECYILACSYSDL